MARQHTSEPRPTRHRQPKTGNARADTLIGLAEDFAANSGRETRPELRHFPAIALAGANKGKDPFGYRTEAVQLMRLAQSLSAR